MPLNPKRARVEPLAPPYSPDQQAALDLLGPPIALFRVFARRPELATGISGWGHYYLSRRSSLSLRQRELVIDRTTARCGADYEWGVHVAAFAGKVGLTDEQVASLAHGQPSDACWADDEAAILAATDELHRTCDLADETWDALVAATSPDAAVELTLIAGWYHAISYAVRALRLPLEPGTSGIPAP